MKQRIWLELIKDYELEVHYHPGKANVVTDALSLKHCRNHLAIQPHPFCCDPEEQSLWVVLHGRLYNIALILTIKEDAITTQRMDVGMGHTHRRLELGEAQCFWQDADGLWFKDCLVVPKDLELRRNIMDEAHCSRYSIHLGTNKMYQDLKKSFWWTRIKREIVKYVSECDTWRRVKADHLRPAKIYSHWASLSGNGKISAWTSLWVCPAPRVGTTRYGSLWTAWLSQLTLYPYPPHIGSDSMPSSTCHTLSAIMVSQRSLSLTEGLSLWHIFGNNYMTVWVHISSEAQPIILRLMDRLSESIKSSKIWFILTFWMMVQSGINTFH
jgi:hypothetical protein